MKLKREILKEQLSAAHNCSGFCQECGRKLVVIDKMCDAKIPVEYWMLTMDKFLGPAKLKEVVDNYIANIKQNYAYGKSLCFVGNQGIGKTMAAVCILRAALKNNFAAHYITACDLLSESVDFRSSADLKRMLKNIDFLVIDEVDSRFFVSDSSKELFSGIYENIFRHRAQNLLPTIICSNETDNLINVFHGQSAKAIESLNNRYLEIVPLIGQDIRKKK